MKKINVKNNSLGFQSIAGFRLRPGSNILEGADAEKMLAECKKNKTVQGFVEKQIFEFHDLEVDESADESGTILDGLNVNDSIAIVKELNDLAELDDLKKSETRKGVLKVIDEQIEAINKALKPDEQEG